MVEKPEGIEPKSERSIPKPDRILASMDWERRLEIARAQRAQIQAEVSKNSEEPATEKLAGLKSKSRENSPTHPASVSEASNGQFLTESDRSAYPGLGKENAQRAEIVPETMDWEDRIARLQNQRQRDQEKLKELKYHTDLVQSESLPATGAEVPLEDFHAVLPPDKARWNESELRLNRPPPASQPTTQTAGAMPIATSTEPSRSRISGWRAVAGFAVGATIGMVIASGDVLKDTARQVSAKFSIASSETPSAMTLVEVKQPPKFEADMANLSAISAVIDAPIDWRTPDQLTLPKSPEVRSFAVALPSVARPSSWNPPQIGVPAATLSDSTPKMDTNTEAIAYAVLAPYLDSVGGSNSGAFAPETEGWFRTATKKPDLLHWVAPKGLSAPVESPPGPSIETPALTGPIASARTSTVPELRRRGVVGSRHASSLATPVLANTGWALHTRPVALTAPNHGFAAMLIAESSAPIVRNAETGANAKLVPVLADFPKHRNVAIIGETDDWFRTTTLKPETLRLVAPDGLSASEGEPQAPLVEMSAISDAYSASSALPVLVSLTDNFNRLPDHFSTIPETPQFVIRSATLGIPEPKPRPALTLREPVDFEGVIVHILAPSSVSDERLNGIAGTLKEAGYPIKDPARVSFTIRQNNVRYYSAKDAEIAQALAKIVGGTARDFTTFSPSPPKGTIEVWFAGANPSKTRTAKATPARTKPVRTKKQPNKAEQDLNRLRNRLVKQLRRGDHL